jgi:hypothetical protein
VLGLPDICAAAHQCCSCFTYKDLQQKRVA